MPLDSLSLAIAAVVIQCFVNTPWCGLPKFLPLPLFGLPPRLYLSRLEVSMVRLGFKIYSTTAM